MKIKDIRHKFPIFKQQIHGHPLIYVDSASSAQMPQMVLDAIVQYYVGYKANVGRGVYAFAEKATHEYELAREKVAQFINAQNSEIIFTAGATDGINKVVSIWARHHIKTGDEIVISAVEHHSNFVPWQQFCLRTGAKLVIVPVNQYGIIDVHTFKNYLSKKTKLVSVVHTSNILGTTNDVELITKISHEFGAKVLIDAAQSVAHCKIDVKKIGCEFLVFSGHKLFGPTGVGVLYLKESVYAECRLDAFGGGMVFSVSNQDTEIKDMPYCFEPGTPNIAGVIGLGSAIDFITEYIDYKALQQHETALTDKLVKGLNSIAGIELLSPMSESGASSHLVTFYSAKYHAHDIAAHFDQYGIAVRAGHHCVQPYHMSKGFNASVRVSFSVYNSLDEVEKIIEILKLLF